ncbi:hypothetical protein GGI25_002610 [Coemansia spiralis]|uniref:Uncharacterized protein n=2 Tax=Coemansia TaxID=4863 RepID=A0A9W8G7J6_9FUNG|nr:hypothetical protein EDC05_002900 [Coemansia umbellata]KAJ2623346.1 hypothetical protein GGI26_002384 [Coemansia sp. RSA 1358]KAJ2678106.1 hypothetical protein GGI25_002610 [Coemansia spiralis]
MEYFAKFTRQIAKPRKPPSPDSTQLAKFEKAWKTAQSVSYYQSKWRGTPVDKTPLPSQLGIMFDLLVQEDIRQADTDDSTTGACMEYLLGNNILDELVQLAESDQPVGIRKTVITNLTTFVSLTDDKLLVQKAVHNPILDILRSYSHQSAGAEAQAEANMSQSAVSIFNTHQHIYDDEFVDLLYAICSKIRGEPMLLNIFFQDRKWLKSVEQRSFSTESITAMMRSVESLRGEGGTHSSSYEFLLFSHLLRFVHRDGKAGDTARTSLLFLLELATTEIMASTGGNTALERFILEDSGFAAILSATLGALYSQLPRSLQVSTGPAAVIPESFPSYSADLQNAIESSIFSVGATNGGADRWTDDQGPVRSSNPEFRACLSSFANLLGFIQEVLFRCPSPYVCDQLLINLRDNFLQSILYPSLLESSDTDGSSVAVMRYLETMLQVARHEDLASVIMDFLTDESTAAGDIHATSGTTGSSRSLSEQSSSLPGVSDKAQSNTGCLPFTLRDLVYTNLQSSVSIDSVVSALNLLRLILVKHCRYSSRLIEVEKAQPSGIKNGWMTNCTVSIDVHRQELEMYAKLMVQLQSDSVNGSIGYSGNSNAGGGLRRDGAEPESPMLLIPWRHDGPPTTPSSMQFGDRVRLDVRAFAPESFSVGYDAYLEDAALDWEAHEAYHAELDALFAAQAARNASIAGQQSPGGSAQKNAAAKPEPSGTISAISQGKQLKMRPRKYSEAVMMLPDSKNAMVAATSKMQSSGGAAANPSLADRRGYHNSQCKHTRYNIRQSDPIVRVLMNMLTKYFAQPRECNLALTGVIAALVGCPYRSLDLWLGFNMAALLGGVLSKPWNSWMDNLRNISDDEQAQAGSSDSEGEDDPRGNKKYGGGPATAIASANASKYVGLDHDLQTAIKTLPKGATPPSLFVVINGLVQQAKVLRNEIPDFSRRLKRARNALMGIVEDVDDLDEEFESTSCRSESNAQLQGGGTTKTRDRGLSSASLESTRGTAASFASGHRMQGLTTDRPHSPRTPSSAAQRNRSTSVTSSINPRQPAARNAAQEDVCMADSTIQPKNTLSGSSTRIRSGSVSHTSEMASISSTSTGANGHSSPTNAVSTISAAAASGESALSGTAWHTLSVPPANANIAEFLENVIILQESIKEIIARVQVRRENGGDENAVF